MGILKDLVTVSKREKTNQISLTIKKREMKKRKIKLDDLLKLNINPLKKWIKKVQ